MGVSTYYINNANPKEHTSVYKGKTSVRVRARSEMFYSAPAVSHDQVAHRLEGRLITDQVRGMGEMSCQNKTRRKKKTAAT